MRPTITPSIRMMTVAAAAAATTTGTATTSALQQQQHSSRFVYRLGNSLYVPLTSRCNSLTLPQLRGDGFFLPTPVVGALCRVREAELRTGSKEQQTRSGDLPPKTKLPPPPFEAVASLPPLDGENERTEPREPKLDDLLREIQQEVRDASYGSSNNDEAMGGRIESIVISGEGEPTLRLDDTIELVRRIKSFTDALQASSQSEAPAPSIRLTTNGLVAPPANRDYESLPQHLWDRGVSRISIGLMTWNAEQYDDLVRPVPLATGAAAAAAATNSGFDRVCGFIREAVGVDGDLEVETTAVDREDVDRAKTEALSESLGVRTPVRWRPFFP